MSAPDPLSAWAISRQIVDGEYAITGLAPGPGDRVIDIGANVGIFSLWAIRRGAAHVTAYEPAPGTFACLASNARGREIDVNHAAVVGRSPASGRISLFVHPDVSTRSTLTGREIGTGAALTTAVEVPAVELDAVLAAEVDLLKVDCEGAEFEQFEQVTDRALRRASRIVLEFHRSIGDPEVLVQRLADAGFAASVRSGAEPHEPFGVIGALRRGTA